MEILRFEVVEDGVDAWPVIRTAKPLVNPFTGKPVRVLRDSEAKTILICPSVSDDDIDQLVADASEDTRHPILQLVPLRGSVS